MTQMTCSTSQVHYRYDGAGQRIYRKIIPQSPGLSYTEYYLDGMKLDPSGQITIPKNTLPAGIYFFGSGLDSGEWVSGKLLKEKITQWFQEKFSTKREHFICNFPSLKKRIHFNPACNIFLR